MTPRPLLLLVAAAALAAAAPAGPGRAAEEAVRAFASSSSAAGLGPAAARAVQALRAAGLGGSESEYPYWQFLGAPLAAALVPGAPPSRWAGACFRNTTAWMEADADDPATFHVTLQLAEPSSLLCSDYYFFGTVSGFQQASYFRHGTHRLTWTLPADARPSEAWDVREKGVRVFANVGNFFETVGSLVSTLELFYDDVVGPGVPDWVAEKNHDFLSKYAPGITGGMQPRAGAHDVDINASLIHSGDFFGVLRMDGLDPLLAWAMGSTTGHTTVALREYEPDGPLWVTESTVKDDYWPTPEVQKHRWEDWIADARRAGFNVVWAPLAEERRARFDTEAAWRHFNATEGFKYGYHNLLFGWFDTPEGNLPCFPPDFKRCVEWDMLEVVLGLLHRHLPSLGDMVYEQAMNHRLGTSGLVTPDIFAEVARRNLSVTAVMARPEQDAWQYNTTRHGKPAVGPSMVCCVWVSSLWRAAGVLGDLDYQFTEQTNADDYQLAIFSDAPRPSQCAANDPNNTLCQLGGRYELLLNDYNTVKPYPHMHETCPTQAGFPRSPTC